VHSRLDRAREKLRRGLLRRGIVLSGTPLAASLAPRSASASIPPLLCETTARAAIAFAARRATGGALSAPAAALAREATRTMLAHKLNPMVRPALALAAAATGSGSRPLALAGAREGEPHPSRERERAVAPASGALPLPDGRGSVRRGAPDPDPARMTVAGR